MRRRLKICGITNAADALRAAELGVDLLGFNFYPESPRYVTPDKAAQMITQLPFTTQSVGIFVNTTAEEIAEIVRKTGIHAAQVYGLRNGSDFECIPVPVIRAVRIAQTAEAADFRLQSANMVLVDAYSKHAYGGSGHMFNWSLIPTSFPRSRLILAGGITVQNLQQALQSVGPACIDVASGAEKAPGIKDFNSIKTMLKILNDYNRTSLSEQEN